MHFHRTLVCGLALALMPLGGALALEPVTVTPLWTKTETASGQPITLPSRDVHVVVSIFDIAPAASLPVHKHPFARYALVQAGTLEVTNVETGEAKTYTAGDFIVEMIDQWHRARNAGEDAVKLLVIDQVEGAVQNTLLGQ
jgi:quercetin dioxygenase-like cupin family protein